MTAGLAVPERVKVVMRMLVTAAEAGQACPSNREIADRLGVDSVSGGANILALLETANLIRVDRGNSSRIVTIVATGKRTAGKVTAPHWRARTGHAPTTGRRSYQDRKRRDEERRAEMARAEPLPTVVHRDPCPRCGVRADVGCRHTTAPLAMAEHV